MLLLRVCVSENNNHDVAYFTKLTRQQQKFLNKHTRTFKIQYTATAAVATPTRRIR